MTTQNNKSGERLSFCQLFTEKGYHIEIPIIQRDYAQGRSTSNEVRELFLQSLYEYLEENRPNRDLDFVYGSVVCNGTKKLILLDGQQRLTTLFLLHWYLANISGNKDLFKSMILFNNEGHSHSKFTYETRSSSREFCDMLVTNDIDINKIPEVYKENIDCFSKTIKNSNWFFASWEKDPTIASMLNMLDAIHIKFQNKPIYFERLTNKNPIITFLFLNLKEFKLTDDLYIKMNSRGKPLTQFENFKAKIEKKIDTLFGVSANKTIDGISKKYTTREYFSHKIDNEWANLFWQYRNINISNNNFDDELINCIRIIFANQYAAINEKDDLTNLDYLIGTQTARKENDYTDDFSYYEFEKRQALTKKSIEYLINTLDVLSNGDSKIKKHLTDNFYFNEDLIFIKALKHELSMTQRVQLHAYFIFLIENRDDRKGIEHWMRVVHNLTENSIIDSVKDVFMAIKAIEKMLMGSNKILEYLINDSNKIEFFSGRQVQEERIKACLIKKSDEWGKLIFTTEKHNYIKGQIGFILEFSDILDHYERNKFCDWTDDQDDKFKKKFIFYSKRARGIFSEIDYSQGKSSSAINFLWERAVLTKGNYLIPTSSNRYNFLCTNRNIRDYSWKRLLRLNPKETNSDEWSPKRKLVKAVFDDSRFTLSNIKESLSNIVKDIPIDWRSKFVEYPGLIDYCSQGFIRYEGDDRIELLGSSQLNHYHRELYSYALYFSGKEEEELYKPFAWNHEPVRSTDEVSFAFLKGTVSRIEYMISLTFNGLVNSNQESYEIRLNKTKGDKNELNFPKEMSKKIVALGMRWNNEKDSLGYIKTTLSQIETLEFVKNICSKLKE